jgi:hypothetical protein
MSSGSGNQRPRPSGKAPPGNEQAPSVATRGSSKYNSDAPSLDASTDVLLYRLGYGRGYEIGWAHGWAAAEGDWQAFFGVYRSALDRPRHAELDRLRRSTDEPCGAMTCSGCSRCVRADAVAARLRAGRAADYSGEIGAER